MPDHFEAGIETILRSRPDLRGFDQNNFVSGVAVETHRTQDIYDLEFWLQPVRLCHL